MTMSDASSYSTDNSCISGNHHCGRELNDDHCFNLFSKLLQRHEEQYHAKGVGQKTVTPDCATPMTETPQPTPLGQRAENTACDLAAIW